MGEGVVELSGWDEVCRETEAAHAAILKALHRLEDAILASAVRPHEWTEHVHRELTWLMDLLDQHRRAVAPPAGLIGLIDLQGHSRGVTELAGTHERLSHDAESLLRSLASTTRPEASYSHFRRDAAHLTSSVRTHEAEESALIYETNVRVSGGEG